MSEFSAVVAGLLMVGLSVATKKETGNADFLVEIKTMLIFFYSSSYYYSFIKRAL